MENNLQYDKYQRDLASILCTSLKKRSSASFVSAGAGAENKVKPNQEFANKLDKLISKKFRTCKFNSSFMDDIWRVYPAYILFLQKIKKTGQLLKHFNIKFRNKTWVDKGS